MLCGNTDTRGPNTKRHNSLNCVTSLSGADVGKLCLPSNKCTPTHSQPCYHVVEGKGSECQVLHPASRLSSPVGTQKSRWNQLHKEIVESHKGIGCCSVRSFALPNHLWHLPATTSTVWCRMSWSTSTPSIFQGFMNEVFWYYLHPFVLTLWALTPKGHSKPWPC